MVVMFSVFFYKFIVYCWDLIGDYCDVNVFVCVMFMTFLLVVKL